MFKINTLTYEELIGRIISDTNKYCFILGAGASVESGIPLGTALENHSIRYLTGVEDDLDGSPKIIDDYQAMLKSRKLKKNINIFYNYGDQLRLINSFEVLFNHRVVIYLRDTIG